MGFLGLGNYNKPGPGVEKDEPKKAAPIRFFEIFFRKFWKLVQANLLFLIPVTVTLFLFVMISTVLGESFLTPYIAMIPFIFLSPFVSGLTFITRNFTREEHAFIWSDFFKTVKNNFKLFLLNGLICYVVTVVISIALQYYASNLSNNWFFYFPFGICMMAAILFIFTQYYMPVVLITFDLKFKQALKNSFYFGILGMGRNFLLSLILVVVFVGIYLLMGYLVLTMMIAIALIALILFSFCSFLIQFTVYPVVEKYMINPPESQEETVDKAASISSEQEASQKYLKELEEDQEESKYVYVNGRMIKRSELDDD